MRKIVSRVIATPVAGSRLPRASKYATLPWRATSRTAPGTLFCSISLASHLVMRSSCSDESPTVSGLARGKSCAGAITGVLSRTAVISATKSVLILTLLLQRWWHHSRSSRGRFARHAVGRGEEIAHEPEPRRHDTERDPRRHEDRVARPDRDGRRHRAAGRRVSSDP